MAKKLRKKKVTISGKIITLSHGGSVGVGKLDGTFCIRFTPPKKQTKGFRRVVRDVRLSEEAMRALVMLGLQLGAAPEVRFTTQWVIHLKDGALIAHKE